MPYTPFDAVSQEDIDKSGVDPLVALNFSRNQHRITAQRLHDESGRFQIALELIMFLTGMDREEAFYLIWNLWRDAMFEE